MTRALALLCCVLILLPGRAHAYPQLGMGLGAVRECGVDGDGDCRTGMRVALTLDLFGKGRYVEEQKPAEPVIVDGEDGERAKYRGNDSGWRILDHMNCSGGGGKGAEIVLIILLAALVAYGLYLGLAALLSADLSTGFYAEYDAYGKHDGYRDSSVAYGIEVTSYPFERGPLRFHFGAGGAEAATRVTPEDSGASGTDYRRGFGTKVGIGLAPRPGIPGPFLIYDAQYLALRTVTPSTVLDRNRPARLPKDRYDQAVLAGYVLAW